MNFSSSDVRRTVVFATFATLACFYLYWGWSTILADFGGDNAVYWLTANHWSPYGTAVPPAAQFAADSVYPPAYPFVLAAFGGGESLLGAHLVSSVILVLAFVAIYRFFRALGIDWWLTLTLVVLFAGTRITLIEGLQIHSEHLYLLLSYTALLLACRGEDNRTGLYLAAICVAGAYLTRTFGLTLVGSFLAYLACTRRRGLSTCALIIGTPVVLWSALHGGSAHYLSSMAELYGRSGIGGQLASNLDHLWLKWLYCFGEPEQAGFTYYGPAAIALVCVGGTVARARAATCDGLYALAYLALIVIWPYPAEYERLLYPLLPLLFAHGIIAGDIVVRRVLHAENRRAAAILLIVILAATELPFALLAAGRLADRPSDPGFAPYTRSLAWFFTDSGTAIANVGYHRGITEALIDIRNADRVAADECLLAIKPSIVSAYSHRISQGPPAYSAPSAAFERSLEASPCVHLFMMQTASPSFPQPYFPYARLAGRLEVIAAYANPVVDGTPAAILARLKPLEPPAAAAK